MYHSYANYDDLIRSFDYAPKSVVTNDTNDGGLIIGFISALNIWELNKYKKVDTGKRIFNKPIYKFIRCMETEPITSDNQEELIKILIKDMI